MFAAVTKYDEFIGCGGWDGEIKQPEQDGAILISGCPLAEHLCEGFVFDRDVASTCMVHYELLVDLLQRLEEFDRIEMCSFFEDALRLWPVRQRIIVTFLHDLAGTISTVAPLVVLSATGIHNRLAPAANGSLTLGHLSQA